MPPGLFERIVAYADHAAEAQPAAAAIFLLTIAIIQLWPRVGSRLPGPMIAIVVTTAIVHGFDLSVDTIYERFGNVPSSLPSFGLIKSDWSILPELVSPALAIALLAAIESLLSAVVADGPTGGRHPSNAELLAQGIANALPPLFGGIPATGAIARTATNIRNGGRSPVAGVVHSVTLVVVVSVAATWASLIPLATLAGVLVIAYNMSEWRVFSRLLRGPRSDALVLVTTFGLTVAIDLTVARGAGTRLQAKDGV